MNEVANEVIGGKGSGGGGGGATATNLSVTYPNTSQVYITPTTGATSGSVVIINEATASNAGTLSASNYTKLFYQRSFSFYIGSSGGNKRGVSVVFPISYPSAPNVSLTIKTMNGVNDAFCITAQNITTNSLYCEIYRPDGGNWAQELYGFCFLSLS